MSTDNQFGGWLDGTDAANLVDALLRRWLPSTLAEVERKYELDPGTIPWPRSWTHVNVFTADMESQCPRIIIVSPGLADKPSREGDGTYTATWRLAVGAICSSTSRDKASRVAQGYGAAIRLAIMQNRGLEDPSRRVKMTTWEDERFDDIPETTQSGRNLSVATELFTVTMRGALNDLEGPRSPTVDPTQPPAESDPGPWPSVDPDRIDIQIRRKDE